MRVRLYRRERSPYWYVSYQGTEGSVRRYSLGIRDEKTARLKANEIERQLALGVDPVKEAAKRTPLSDFFERYLEYAKNANTESNYKNKVNRIKAFLRLFGDVPLETVTTEQLEKYRNARRRTVSAGTVNRDFAVIRHALNVAVQWGYLEKSPADGVKNYRPQPGRVRFLTDKEYESLLSACDDGLRDVIITAVNTGLRNGELFALDVKDINFGRKLLTVRKGKTQEARVIPLNGDAVKALRSAIGKRGQGPIFDSTNFRKRFEKVKTGIDDFTFHDLRHTFASWLVMNGVDLATVSKLMGHKTIQMTMRYAHLAPDYLADSVHTISTKGKRGKSKKR
jgi:integrase